MTVISHYGPVSGEQRTASTLRLARVHRGLTQADLAQLAGLSQASISLLERRLRVGTPAAQTAIATVLNIDQTILFPETNGAGAASADPVRKGDRSARARA